MVWPVNTVAPSTGLQTPLAPSVPSPTLPSGILKLRPMVGCELSPLYLSGSGRASQDTAVSGSCQQAFLGMHSSVWVWCLYRGWIPKWGSLWMVFVSVFAPHFVSVSPPMGILFPLLRSIHTLIFLLLEFHVFFKLYLELLG